MRTHLFFIITIALSLGFIGCQHNRTCLMVAVEDLGPQIATQNKYRLVGTVYGLRQTDDFKYDKENSKQLGEAHTILKSAQPQTFADDGIPFIIRQTMNLPQNYESLVHLIYTLFLPVISVSTFQVTPLKLPFLHFTTTQLGVFKTHFS